ncbi:hypothetical protein AAFF_G00057570 [Aldrovandia affinis]|uniref:Uncharacterized protein n=1 Tax=Aldrovandia affinis TaxID=143900 RepID=A0AAD7WF75_9TELE|nr:hypothetical protein AAFF_G00057570 [Aldrovandia affinis]
MFQHHRATMVWADGTHERREGEGGENPAPPPTPKLHQTAQQARRTVALERHRARPHMPTEVRIPSCHRGSHCM